MADGGVWESCWSHLWAGDGGGHEWAPVHRWAVALDDGRLVFVDTKDVTIDPGSYRSAPNPDSAVRAVDSSSVWSRVRAPPAPPRSSPCARQARG
ncbi:hypothetical protein [Rhodococcus sp. USK13]|uniref:hypothetical protein n=1 Tax=Rhodococcus sp. USK13 TaxID=2806442 RepID=UPI00201666BD|nr:hypothetical protein [Rhodococcus sp. USK13]